MLLSLPEDIVSHVVQFLDPVDFYAVKTATAAKSDANRLYWWPREVTLARAARAKCASLVTWIGQNDLDLEVDEVLQAAAETSRRPHADSYRPLVAIYNLVARRWPGEVARLMSVFAEYGSVRIFQYAIVRGARVDDNVFDMAYFCARWIIIALAFQYAPREFIHWTFGDYKHVADVEVVTNLRFVIAHLDARNREALCRILVKYHEWLWTYRVNEPESLVTIAALQNLEHAGTRIIAFQPAAYLDRAMRSRHAAHLEYLLMCGLEADPAIMQRTRDLDKLKVLMTAQVAQKYYRIMVMILVLVGALMLNLFSCSYSCSALRAPASPRLSPTGSTLAHTRQRVSMNEQARITKVKIESAVG